MIKHQVIHPLTKYSACELRTVKTDRKRKEGKTRRARKSRISGKSDPPCPVPREKVKALSCRGTKPCIAHCKIKLTAVNLHKSVRTVCSKESRVRELCPVTWV